MQYPRMVYLYPGASDSPAALQDGKYDTKIVDSDADLATAQGAGWCLTPADARQGYETAQKAASDAAAAAAEAKALADAEALVAAANAPPTRAELEEKATQLGLKFDGRTSDKKLGDLIAASLET